MIFLQFHCQLSLDGLKNLLKSERVVENEENRKSSPGSRHGSLLGVAAFAVDAEDANTTTTEEATPTVTIDQILEWIKGTIMPEINMDLMKEVIKQTKATIENIVELLKPFFDKNQNPNLPDASEIPAAMMNAFIDLLAKAFKTDRDTIINKLLEIPLVKKIMGWYGYKPATTTEAPATSAPETTEAPAETEVPNTGAAAAVAAVASLSVAAAAAFVSKKKAA